MAIQLNVPYKDKKIPAKIDCINNEDYMKDKIWIVLTHGAGGDLNTSQLSALALFLSKLDFVIFRFTCKGLNIKFRTNVYTEVLKFICKSYNPRGIFIGGRSMGARAAVMLKEKDLTMPVFEKIWGIICLSYPLHKVNHTNDLRDEPLKQSQKPLFFLSGTKDEMCKKNILEKVVLSIKSPYKIYWLEGTNHSAILSKNFDDNTYIQAFQALAMWCTNISRNA